jgi:protein NirF
MLASRFAVLAALLLAGCATVLLAGCAVVPPSGCAAGPPLRGTGDLGLVIERADGKVMRIESSHHTALGEIAGLGDLSHASVVFSRDERFAYVFGRDGGLTKIDLLEGRIAKRVVQAGNSIGGAISQSGRLVAVANYEPGGIKVFDSDSLDLVADIPAEGPGGKRSKVVGIADLPGERFIYSLFDAGEIDIADLSDPKAPKLSRFPGIGTEPYDGLVTEDGRWYVAGLFGEDGLALLDLWHPEAGVRRILDHYGRGELRLPVYKMPHMRGWAVAGDEVWLPAVGHHEVLVIDKRTWTEKARIPVAGQPVFVVARPDGRQVWVNFALPDNGKVQVIDAPSKQVMRTLEPGEAILHIEFTPKGEEVWLSARDSDRVMAYDTASLAEVARLPAAKPSGIFFTDRARRMGM